MTGSPYLHDPGAFFSGQPASLTDGLPCTLNQAAHCWHGDGRLLLSDPPQERQTCCWCGATRVVQVGRMDTRQHGPHRSGEC